MENRVKSFCKIGVYDINQTDFTKIE